MMKIYKPLQYLLAAVMLVVILSTAACQNAGATPAAAAGTQAPTVVVGKPVILQDGSNGTYTDISVAELQTMLTKKDFVLINVHTPYDGKLDKTDLMIAYDQIDKNLAKLPADKSAKIVLYCRSGRMSAIAAETLVKDGYTNIFNLVGGMDAWKTAGLTVLQ